jgi:cardiolipin synthase
MRLAEERIWITQAYFAPDKEFLQLLASSARRGVDVRLLAPGLSDSAMVLSASRSRYGDLLEAGVRIFENQNAVLHAKTAVIDGIWSTVGSSNLDYRSFLHNDEVNAIVIGEEFGLEMEKQFLQDMTQAREIELHEWNDRSVWSRFREKLSWTIEYWL